MITRTCKWCAKDFQTYNCQVKRGGGKFCSISCSTTYRNTHNNPTKDPEVRRKISENHADVSGKNNPWYGKRGKMFHGYKPNKVGRAVGLEAGDYYRLFALEKLGKVCMMCSSIKNLEVHHIDGDRKHNDIINLIVLCRKCHKSTAHRAIRDDLGRFKKIELVDLSHLKESDALCSES